MESNKEDRDVRIVFCAKILLYRDEWRIRFLCQFCFKERETLPDLLRHALGHFSHIKPDKIEELILPHIATDLGTDTNEEYLIECDNSPKESDNTNSKIYEEYLNEEDDTNDNREETETETQINEQVRIENDVVVSTEEEKAVKDKVSYDDAEDEEWANEKKTPSQFEFLDIQDKVLPLKPISTQQYHVPCLICQKKFRTRELLLEHKRSHGEKPHICDICGVGFKEKCNLNCHRARHLGIKPFKCKVCEKSFTTSTERIFHMRTHTGERPYRCTDCGEEFRSSSNLTKHRQRHNNESGTFLCNICGESFFYAFKLRDHMQTHSGERPFECTKCNARFKHTKGLRIHMLLHADEKKFKCKYCQKAFAQSAGYYTHVKRMHPKDWNADKQNKSKRTEKTNNSFLEIEIVKD